MSETLSPFLLPIIQLSTDLSEACSVYLIEDGLELWLTVLHNTKKASPELLQLAKNIPPILGELQRPFDVLKVKQCIQVCQRDSEYDQTSRGRF